MESFNLKLNKPTQIDPGVAENVTSFLDALTKLEDDQITDKRKCAIIYIGPERLMDFAKLFNVSTAKPEFELFSCKK